MNFSQTADGTFPRFSPKECVQVSLLRQFLGRLLVGSPLRKFSSAGQLARGNHSQVFYVLTDKNAEFRQNYPRIVVLSLDRK
jgi:hypothetical protein